MKVNIITLGCSKNTVDSENLAGRYRADGHQVYFDREQNDCDLVVVNTCGFIGDAKEESINTILAQIAAKKRRHNRTRLVVCGCLVQRYRDELAAEMPEVDEWQGVESEEDSGAPASRRQERYLSTPQHYAYLKIAEGCDRRCSYCAIPLIRGAHRSRPIDELVAEAKSLVSQGVKEIIVISQDTTYYGLDLYHRRALGDLLERLATESGASWIRLHYTYPSSFPQDAIEVMRRHDNICNYIDIPLQHINSRILGSMQRGIDREGTLHLLDTFRRQLPDAAIRTTLIVGYPGETRQDFDELKEFVRQARFDRMGCFPYSPEEGTAAYRLPDDVPDDEKQRRVDELMALQADISLQKNLERVGHTYRVIVDSIEPDGTLIGRTEYDSPEVDDEVIVNHADTCHLHPGDFISVRILSALDHDLVGEIVK